MLDMVREVLMVQVQSDFLGDLLSEHAENDKIGKIDDHAGESSQKMISKMKAANHFRGSFSREPTACEKCGGLTYWRSSRYAPLWCAGCVPHHGKAKQWAVVITNPDGTHRFADLAREQRNVALMRAGVLACDLDDPDWRIEFDNDGDIVAVRRHPSTPVPQPQQTQQTQQTKQPTEAEPQPKSKLAAALFD